MADFSSSAAGGAESLPERRNPADFLKDVIGKPVLVKLNSGVDYKGILACLDRSEERRTYEYCIRANRRVRGRAIEKQIW